MVWLSHSWVSHLEAQGDSLVLTSHCKSDKTHAGETTGSVNH